MSKNFKNSPVLSFLSSASAFEADVNTECKDKVYIQSVNTNDDVNTECKDKVYIQNVNTRETKSATVMLRMKPSIKLQLENFVKQHKEIDSFAELMDAIFETFLRNNK